MSTRSILIAALAIAGLAACKTKYNDVYSFKKNNFKPPPTKRVEIKAPENQGLPGTQAMPPGTPGGPSDIPGIPGLTPPPANDPTAPAPTGIPGLDAPPAPSPATPPAI